MCPDRAACVRMHTLCNGMTVLSSRHGAHANYLELCHRLRQQPYLKDNGFGHIFDPHVWLGLLAAGMLVVLGLLSIRHKVRVQLLTHCLQLCICHTIPYSGTHTMPLRRSKGHTVSHRDWSSIFHSRQRWVYHLSSKPASYGNQINYKTGKQTPVQALYKVPHFD